MYICAVFKQLSSAIIVVVSHMGFNKPHSNHVRIMIKDPADLHVFMYFICFLTASIFSTK
jgi:hypothetical protein